MPSSFSEGIFIENDVILIGTTTSSSFSIISSKAFILFYSLFITVFKVMPLWVIFSVTPRTNKEFPSFSSILSKLEDIRTSADSLSAPPLYTSIYRFQLPYLDDYYLAPTLL